MLLLRELVFLILLYLIKLCAFVGLNCNKSDEIFLKSFVRVYNSWIDRCLMLQTCQLICSFEVYLIFFVGVCKTVSPAVTGIG